MSRVFISYRRDDSADITGRIYDRLRQRFGADNVFKDVDSIPYGVNFATHLEQTLAECEVVLVVVGPEWGTIADEEGRPRLHDPNDYVRIEVETALNRDIPVIPLLVRGASFPPVEDLPETLQEIVMRNGTPVRRDPDFDPDMQRVGDWVEAHLSEATKERLKSVAERVRGDVEVIAERVRGDVEGIAGRLADDMRPGLKEMRKRLSDRVSKPASGSAPDPDAGATSRGGTPVED